MTDNIFNATPSQSSVVLTTLENVKKDEQSSLADVAEQFEAIFVNELMKAARSAKLYDEPLNTSGFTPLLEMSDCELSQNVPEQSKFGIAEAIVNQFSRR